MMGETKLETATRKSLFWRRARYCNVIGTVLGVLLVMPFFVLLLDRRQPIELIEGKMIPDVVRPGQTVAFVWRARELAASEGEFTRRFVDGCGTLHTQPPEPTVYRVHAREGIQQFSREFKLPEGLCEGWGTYSTTGYRWRNFLQKLIWKIPFESPVAKYYVVRPSKPEDDACPTCGLSSQEKPGSPLLDGRGQ